MKKSVIRLRLRAPFVFCLLSAALALAAIAGTRPGTPEAPAVLQSEMRCGWFDNPTPANAWLHDREAEWTIGVQGGHQAEGDWPSFGPKQWVETNGHYGYGCACMRLQVNRETHEVIKIESARAR